MTDFAFGPNISNGAFTFGPNIVEAGTIPVILGYSNHVIDEYIILDLEGYEEPLTNVNFNGVEYLNATGVGSDEATALVTRDGVIGVEGLITVTDANGQSLPFATTRLPKTGWGFETGTVDYSAASSNSFLGDTNWTGFVAGDQFSYEETTSLGDTIAFDSAGLITSAGLQAGNHSLPIWRNDASNGYAGTVDDTLILTVLNSTPTIAQFTNEPIAVSGQVYQEVLDVLGIDLGGSMYITAGSGGTSELSNDGGSTWSAGPLEVVADQALNKLRMTVTAGINPADVVTGSVTLNGVTRTKVLTTAGSATAGEFQDPPYDNPATITTGQAFTFTRQMIAEPNPAANYTVLSGSIIDGGSFDANGNITGTAGAVGVYTWVTQGSNTQGTFTGQSTIEILPTVPFLRITGANDKFQQPIPNTLLEFKTTRLSDNNVTRGTVTTDGNSDVQITSGVTATGVDFEVELYYGTQSIAKKLVTSI